MKEICICAAVKTKDGLIIRGHRHSDCYLTITTMKKETSNEQGFITSKNRYVDRVEGAKLQNEAGIVSVWTNKPVIGLLLSEDLY